MPGDNCTLFAHYVEYAHHIAHKMKERVLVDRIGAVRLSVAAHIWRNYMKTGIRQRLQLISP